MVVDPSSVPDFDKLPKVTDMPQGCTWGLFDQDGKKDILGTLNFLTPSVVKAAATEVQDGVSISLNWGLDSWTKYALVDRRPVVHKTIFLSDVLKDAAPPNFKGWDDELEFNTQGSSQWDSLCHMQHMASGLAYNGFNPDRESMTSSEAPNGLPTLEHWHQRGCMVARGVLVDYMDFVATTGYKSGSFRAVGSHRIGVEDLEACVKHFGLEFRPGDVLLVRTGLTQVADNPSDEEHQLLKAQQFSGLESGEEMARWLWDHRFTAAVSDAFSLEAWPFAADGLTLHEYLLSLFGMPIGELWDLSKLSAYCKQRKRYSFLLTSAPLNHKCLIGSPPNAIAIF